MSVRTLLIAAAAAAPGMAVERGRSGRVISYDRVIARCPVRVARGGGMSPPQGKPASRRVKVGKPVAEAWPGGECVQQVVALLPCGRATTASLAPPCAVPIDRA